MYKKDSILKRIKQTAISKWIENILKMDSKCAENVVLLNSFQNRCISKRTNLMWQNRPFQNRCISKQIKKDDPNGALIILKKNSILSPFKSQEP